MFWISEYAYTMRVTMAANVQSFGVILLELLSGKPAVCEGTELAKCVVSKSAQQDKWDQILDFRCLARSKAEDEERAANASKCKVKVSSRNEANNSRLIQR